MKILWNMHFLWKPKLLFFFFMTYYFLFLPWNLPKMTYIEVLKSLQNDNICTFFPSSARSAEIFFKEKLALPETRFPKISPKWHLEDILGRFWFPKMTDCRKKIYRSKSPQNDILERHFRSLLIPKSLPKTTDCRKKYICLYFPKMTFRKTF